MQEKVKNTLPTQYWTNTQEYSEHHSLQSFLERRHQLVTISHDFTLAYFKKQWVHLS